jgi:hypothetical protein
LESIPGHLKRYQIRALGFLKFENTVSVVTLSKAYYIHVKYNISTLLPPSINKLVHTMEVDIQNIRTNFHTNIQFDAKQIHV